MFLIKILKEEKIVYQICLQQNCRSFYFRYVFQQIHGVKRENIIPRFWQPMWSGVKEGEYIDPSARVLSVYDKEEKKWKMIFNN